jgi:hypothetical protein
MVQIKTKLILNIMSSPKQKAEELVSKIFNAQHVDDRAKMICLSTIKIAIICVEEILELDVVWYDIECIEFDHKVRPEQTMEFWEEVLTELKAMK